MTVRSLSRCQVVFSNVLENFEEVEKLNVGAAIIVTGKLVATPGDEAAVRDSGGED